MNKKSLLNRFTNFIAKEENVSARKKVFSSLWAIFIGILISSIFLLFLKVNPIKFFSIIISKSLHPRFINRFLITISVLVLSSIAVGIGFKAGMFNIGIPGQMMASGITSVVVLSYVQQTPTTLVLALVAGMLVAMFCGIIAGVLKAYLNINEVVVTILLNWIVFYICWQLLSSDKLPFKNPTAAINGQSILLGVNSLNTLWMSLIIVFGTVIFAIMMWFVLKRTTIGYRIKMTGFNKDASIYSGTNEKMLIISLMGFSALIAGIAGFLWFVFGEKQMILSSGPVSIGFDSIAISLLAHNSPIGSIFTSIFYSFIIVGSVSLQSLNSLLDQTTVQIITGIIIYLSAISIIFSKIRIIARLTKLWILIKSKSYFIALSNEKQLILLKKQLNKLTLLLEKVKANNIANDDKIMQLETKIAKKVEQITQLENSSIDKCDCYTLVKTHYQNLKAKANSSSQNNFKNSIEYLECEIDSLNNLIEILTNAIKNRKIAILRGYFLVRFFLIKRKMRMIKLAQVNNAPNKEKYKQLQNMLKDMLKLSTSKMTQEERLNYFKDLSLRKREVNRELANIGFFDIKAIKEQYKTQIIDLNNTYTNSVSEIIDQFKENHSWFKMEVM